MATDPLRSSAHFSLWTSVRAHNNYRLEMKLLWCYLVSRAEGVNGARRPR
jgi:hypothetical protein